MELISHWRDIIRLKLLIINGCTGYSNIVKTKIKSRLYIVYVFPGLALKAVDAAETIFAGREFHTFMTLWVKKFDHNSKQDDFLKRFK